jgi:hypothetical protein
LLRAKTRAIAQGAALFGAEEILGGEDSRLDARDAISLLSLSAVRRKVSKGRLFM